MGGGHIQLVALGAQDIYINGNPQISFFKAIYRRHTNFSIECIEVQNSGSISSSEHELTYNIGRHGDLLYKCHLEIDLPAQDNVTADYCNYSNNTAHSYVKRIDFEIGDKLVDRHFGKWYDIRNTLWEKNNQENILINKHEEKVAYLSDTTLPKHNKIFCPLHFWFCREIGLALPLIALQYHDVNFKITYRGIKDIINSDVDITPLTSNLPSIKLWCNYIYLDTDERKKFAQGSHEYLIEQIQENTNKFSSNVPLTFNHPIKELFWVIQKDTVLQSGKDNIDSTLNIQTENNWTHKNDYLNYMRDNDINDASTYNKFNVRDDIVYDHFDSCKMIINGTDRFDYQKAPYFRTIEPYNAGHAIPFTEDKLIYMYSFALKPTEYQPSGSMNFSKLDNVSLNFLGNLSDNYTITTYAINYNVLRIMSGMGGILYSN